MNNKINKIYTQIDKIASIGKDNFLEYYQYVDDSIGKSDYDNLLQCLCYNYNIEVEKLYTIDDVKKKTWSKIIEVTNTILSKKIKKLYDNNGVYQTSFNIYNNSNILLGQIEEVDDFDEEAKYYIKNKLFSKIMKTRRFFLKVTKVGEETILLNSYNYSLSDDENIYNKYVEAINILTT